ncbi:hypothetical protein GCM10020258_09940 [Sphingomonas yabuuchiae]
MPLTADDDIRDLLANARTIALVGASDRPDRPSYGVMKRLQDHGYRVIPVNPQITGEHVHGEFVFRELGQLGDPIDIVDIFRRSEAAGDVVDEAIAIGAKAVWLQLGVVNEAAAARAEAAGLKVVMNRCPAIEIRAWASRRSGRTEKKGKYRQRIKGEKDDGAAIVAMGRSGCRRGAADDPAAPDPDLYPVHLPWRQASLALSPGAEPCGADRFQGARLRQ